MIGSLRCKIADLITEVPAAGGMSPRCQEYLHSGSEAPQIVISAENYHRERYPQGRSEERIAYMESAYQFYVELLKHNGFYLHSSAVALDGKAYLFSGPSGMGKSTHTRIWTEVFGKDTLVFNDDKPALRRLDGRWYAYGTPWCGKDGINRNRKVPLAGICFLQQGSVNEIRRLEPKEALPKLISQTLRRGFSVEAIDLLLGHVGTLVEEIPIFELVNRPEPEAARLSHETMYRAAKEAGL